MRAALWLERGTAEDAPLLAALEAECFSHPWTEEQFRQEVALGAPGAVLVLRVGGPGPPPSTPLAAYCAYRLTAGEMHIMDVAVASGWRRRGLATWLLRFCVARAARAGAARAFLEVRASNVAARNLYRGLGFDEIGTRRDYYFQPVEDAVVLSLDPIPAAFC